ncbi:hypothetical protein CU103_09395 [Phyllobacterium sophorae]|uniref:Uncharacterized protein n=1 Tax=Phyllobacterium sophorae TaxID=1520277 RepID=A0A2P7BFE6_9HYPH|nr:hypothetical protein CU103_09395 [Phyllobacterium sophorae]
MGLGFSFSKLLQLQIAAKMELVDQDRSRSSGPNGHQETSLPGLTEIREGDSVRAPRATALFNGIGELLRRTSARFPEPRDQLRKLWTIS